MEVPYGTSNFEKGMKTSCATAGRHVPWWRQRCGLVLAACLAAVLLVMVIVIPLLTCESVTDNTTAPLSTYADLSTEVPVEPEFMLSDGRPIVRRWEWSDVPPDFRRPLHHPTPYVVIAHTAGTACRSEDECFYLLRAYRSEHREKWGQPDIMYNFLIDVKGNVYEGRGWDATNNFQSWVLRCNLGVALMGNFMYYNMTTEMLHSLQQLLELGVILGKLSPDYRLVAHNQVMATISPGTYVLKAIESWPHRCLRDCDVGVECGFQGTAETDA